MWPDLTPLRTARGFRQVFISRTVTALGTQAAEVAVLVQAKQLTGSPLAVGLIGVAELVPLIVFGLYGGVLADRFDRRALLRWCEVGLGCCAVLLLVNALLAKPSVALLFVLVALTMAVSSLQRPSLDASFARLVPRQQLTAASAIMSLSQNIGFLIGTSLGGVLAVAPGPWLVYALDAGGFAVSFCFLSRLQPLPRQVPQDPASDSDSGSASGSGSHSGSDGGGAVAGAAVAGAAVAGGLRCGRSRPGCATRSAGATSLAHTPPTCQR